ncbi:hypothetical protein F383_38075 [Gossypium arboreum]|uniref:Uncharacterized protein n=1 Tax=Gossypium arboreum TaxID=29729 RepID=A0A0B0MG91_GOSAR|nr:hypothetical protein F383_37510 [Gossypium arboreum]KHF98926.1 hypothetical protein F383_38075 [Gossypium arboreum]
MKEVRESAYLKCSLA